MQKLVRDYLNELNKKQKRRRKAGIAALLLVVLVVGAVVGTLTQYGVAWTGEPQCGMEEHTHNDSCYTLACGQKESEGHTHTEACYTTESKLICSQEESETHTHDESCYTEESVLTCGQEESAGHTHTDACYQLDCGMEEHTHTDACYADADTAAEADPNADVEDISVWDAQYTNTEWKELWGEDLAAAARVQLDTKYKESEKSYIEEADGSRRGYTRYGQFVGDAYRDWNTAFVNFCMYYAKMTESGIFPNEMEGSPAPQTYPEGLTDSAKWLEEFKKINEQNDKALACLNEAEGYEPKVGDLVFFEKDKEDGSQTKESRMGVVSSYNKENGELKVIEGDSDGEVKENTYHTGDADAHIVRYLDITALENGYKSGWSDADESGETVPQEPTQTEGEAQPQEPAQTEEENQPEQPAEGEDQPEQPAQTEEDNTETENTEADKEKTDGQKDTDAGNAMKPEELEKMPEDECGAAVSESEPEAPKSGIRRALSKVAKILGINKEWSIDAYYVGEDSRTDVTKTSDFNLKYQIEFHTSRTFEPGEVTIRVERGLFQYRDNKEGGVYVTPDQIAVPQGTPENPNTVNKSMPFNYQIIPAEGDEPEYLEFFNYDTIETGTNIAWQVLYKNLKLMEIEDDQEWKLEPKVTIIRKTETEGSDGNKTESETIEENDKIIETLTGRVNSYAELTSVSKSSYKEYNKQYTPGLYTASQVWSYLAEDTPKEKINEFFNVDSSDPNNKEKMTLKTKEYRYVVWEVIARGQASQPWNLVLEEKLSGDAKVVGYRDNSDRRKGYNVPINAANAARTVTGTDGTQTQELAVEKSKEKSWASRFYVVTAYPKDDNSKDGDELQNTIEVKVVPYDGKDGESAKKASAKWNYDSYKWTYDGNTIGVKKLNRGNYEKEDTYASWLEVYKQLQSDPTVEGYGNIPFTSTGRYYGYGYTHNTDSTSPDFGKYKEGSAYKLITADDFMYAGEGKTNGTMLGRDDYYYTSVTVTQRDYGYDIWEDRLLNTPEENNCGEDQGVEIWAMYRKDGNKNLYAKDHQDQWEKVTEVTDVPWSSDGIMSYSFTTDQLARQPWRVMAKHVSTNYLTTCTIDVNVRITRQSPAMRELLGLGDSENGENTTPPDAIYFEDLSGVIGQHKAKGGNWELTICAKSGEGDKLTSETSSGGVYSEPSLLEGTKSLYSTQENSELSGIGNQYDNSDTHHFPMYRNNAYGEVTGLREKAQAYKQVTDSTSNAELGRGEVVYTLTAHDGYEVFSEEAVNELKRSMQQHVEDPNQSFKSPGRNKVVFYDLLPYGMKFDPSYKVRAGRITDLDTNLNYTRQPGLWNTSQVEVTWKTKEWTPKDESGNLLEATGRTMVIFEITYDKENETDSAVYSNQQWMEGWGISFRAYYDWKDSDIVQKGTNVSAFMPDKEDAESKGKEALCGSDNEVACDNGTVVPAELQKECSAFGYDIDGNAYDGNVVNGNAYDGRWNQGIRNVLYAQNSAMDSIAQSSKSGITKRVKADEDANSTFKESAVVEEGGGYTYEITVAANISSEQNIVVYDQLETEGAWRGKFQSVVVTGLKKLGIDPVIYYSALQDKNNKRVPAEIPQVISEKSNTDTSKAFRGDANFRSRLETLLAAQKDSSDKTIWYKGADAFKEAGYKMADVGAIIVDLSKAINPDTNEEYDFVLGMGQALSFQIKMKAPEKGDGASVNELGSVKNQASFMTKANPSQDSNKTSVTVKEAGGLAVVKEFSGDVPDAVKNTLFEFTLTDSNGAAYDFKEYKLLKKENGTWKTEPEPGQPATDGKGRLYLHADEAAVFEKVRCAEEFTVEESENIFWEDVSERDEETNKVNSVDKTYTINEKSVAVKEFTIKNKYRPVLYVQKELTGMPEDDALRAAEENTEFTFKISTWDEEEKEYTALGNSKYYYVNSVRTDGGIPSIDKTKGDKKDGTGTTEADGTFKIRKGDIIALFPGETETDYKVEEVDTQLHSNWNCLTPDNTVTGTLAVKGTPAVIRNGYKWKDLYLDKKITHQDAGECTEEFTFRIQRLGKDDKDDDVFKDLTQSEVNRLELTLWKPSETDAGKYEGVKGADGKLVSITPKYEVPADSVSKTKVFTFSCQCAGKRIRIRGLEAGATYQIKEVESGTYYRPENDTVEVTMPINSGSDKVTITNDYQKRPLTVTKKVVGTSQVNENEEFVMTVTVNGGPLANYPYTLTKDGKPVELETGTGTGDGTETGNGFKTDNNGKFKLKDGQTAYFKDAGVVGQTFSVQEILTNGQEGTYVQLSPENNEPATGTFAEEGKAFILNGDNTDGDNLYISKTYEAVAGDEAAEAYVEGLKKANLAPTPGEPVDEERDKGSVNITIKVNGTPVKKIDDVTIVNTLAGLSEEVTSSTWTANEKTGEYSLLPWHLVIISKDSLKKAADINDDRELKYSITESRDDQHRIKSSFYMPPLPSPSRVASRMVVQHNLTPNTLVEISQKTPENDGAAEGIFDKASYASIVNEVRSFAKKNRVTKQMTYDSDSVPAGAKLVWRVERFNGKTWLPAKGITYVRAAGAWNMQQVNQQDEIITDDRVWTTGDNGLIVLTKQASEGGARELWPAVYFPKDNVKLNVYNDEKANVNDLRLVEMMDGSTDEAWGMLAMYRGSLKAAENDSDAGSRINDADVATEIENFQSAESRIRDTVIESENNTGTLSRALSISTEKMSSGRKINHAGDDAAGLGRVFYGLNLSKDIADGFVNSNKKYPLEIGKEMEEKSDDEFTMILKQVMSLDFGKDQGVNENRYNKKSYITAAEGRSGIPYTVYDSETGEKKSDEVTGKKGETVLQAGAIVLKAGEYAVLQLPRGTQWTVSENIGQTYELESLTPNIPDPSAERCRLLDDEDNMIDNLMLIRQNGMDSPENRYTVRYHDYVDDEKGNRTWLPVGEEEVKAIGDEHGFWYGEAIPNKPGLNGGSALTREGMEFKGWSYKPYGTSVLPKAALTSDGGIDNCGRYPLYGDVDLYAVWGKKSYTYTVIWKKFDPDQSNPMNKSTFVEHYKEENVQEGFEFEEVSSELFLKVDTYSGVQYGGFFVGWKNPKNKKFYPLGEKVTVEGGTEAGNLNESTGQIEIVLEAVYVLPYMEMKFVMNGEGLTLDSIPQNILLQPKREMLDYEDTPDRRYVDIQKEVEKDKITLSVRQRIDSNFDQQKHQPYRNDINNYKAKLVVWYYDIAGYSNDYIQPNSDEGYKAIKVVEDADAVDGYSFEPYVVEVTYTHKQ